MRAKNEFRFLSTAYDTKLILERVVDGKLMCPEACCGAPVVECTCGEDCPHCNCFMIHKAMKDKDFTDKLLKENLRQHRFFKKGIGSAVKEIFDIPKDEPKEDEEKRLRATNVQQMQIIDNDVKNLKISPEEAIKRSGVDPAYHKDLLRRYKKWAEREASFKDIKPASWFKTPEVKEPSLREILGLEDEEEIDIGTMVKFWRDGPMFGEVVDVDVEQGFAVVETGSGHMRVGPSEKWVVELGELTKAIRRKPRSTQTRFPETRPGRPGFRPAEDNEDSIIPEDERDEPIRNRELPVGHYDHMVRLSRGGRWNTHSVMVRKTEKELIQKFLDQGFRIVKPFDEDNEEIEYENPATRRKEAQRAANERARKRWEDPEYSKEFNVPGLGLDTPKEDNEEPKRGITGHQHTDALAQAALSKDYKHKPYVSSYVGGESDGFRKIFAVLGSDGKVVHKTRDKQEAHQWLKDNYENI